MSKKLRVPVGNAIVIGSICTLEIILISPVWQEGAVFSLLLIYSLSVSAYSEVYI